MSARVLCWGRVADSVGLCRWTTSDVDELAGGGVRATSTDVWAHDAADRYASSHPAPVEVRWRHRTGIGHVIGLLRHDGNLDAVAELNVGDDVVDELVERLVDEGLRWSSSTEHHGRHGPLVIRELSLASSKDVASVGLPNVTIRQVGHHPPRPATPQWVCDALTRAERVHHRDRGVLRVHDDAPRWIDGSPIGRGAPRESREMFYSGGGYVLAVAGRPVRKS